MGVSFISDVCEIIWIEFGMFSTQRRRTPRKPTAAQCRKGLEELQNKYTHAYFTAQEISDRVDARAVLDNYVNYYLDPERYPLNDSDQITAFQDLSRFGNRAGRRSVTDKIKGIKALARGGLSETNRLSDDANALYENCQDVRGLSLEEKNNIRAFRDAAVFAERVFGAFFYGVIRGIEESIA